MAKLYKHHLYPKYMAKKGEIPPWGNPEAIVEVTYTQHTMFHWCNYQLWGNLEDKRAYHFMVSNAEEARILGSKIGVKSREDRRKIDPEYDRKWRAKMSEVTSGEKSSAYGTMWITDGETSKKVRRGEPLPEGFIPGRDKHFKAKTGKAKSGEKNPNYGTMWITDGSQNRKIKKEEPLPEGFRPGRVKSPTGPYGPHLSS